MPSLVIMGQITWRHGRDRNVFDCSLIRVVLSSARLKGNTGWFFRGHLPLRVEVDGPPSQTKIDLFAFCMRDLENHCEMGRDLTCSIGMNTEHRLMLVMLDHLNAGGGRRKSARFRARRFWRARFRQEPVA
jgi:hypothetical protein